MPMNILFNFLAIFSQYQQTSYFSFFFHTLIKISDNYSNLQFMLNANMRSQSIWQHFLQLFFVGGFFIQIISIEEKYIFMSNKKEEKKGPLKLTDLPKGLQQKYKNSIVFQRQYKQPEKKFEFDPQKIKKRKIQKQKTIEEKLKQFQINPTQAKHLYNVFYLLSQNRSVFGHVQITEVLKKMQMTLTGQQIDRMIWEFDQDLDKQISFEEFEKMYKKCMMDKAAAEPKKLFHLAQFLMYCKQGRYRITVEDTLQLLYVRALEESEKTKVPVKDIFEDSIKIIFGDNYEADNNGVEKEISFHEYLQKINQKAIQKRKKEIQKIKSQLRYS